MARTKSFMVRDEHGYINNRGLSKYWGVTISGDAMNWIVSYSPSDDDKTHTVSASDFTLSEKDAARIAAYALDNGSKKNLVMRGEGILSADKQWVFYVRGNDILRVSYNKQKIHRNDNVVKLFDVVEEVKPVMKKPDIKLIRDAKKVVNASGDEAQYVANLIGLITKGDLSEASVNVLIAVLRSTLNAKAE